MNKIHKVSMVESNAVREGIDDLQESADLNEYANTCLLLLLVDGAKN